MNTLSTCAIVFGAFMLTRELHAMWVARQQAIVRRSYAAFTHPLRRRVALPRVSFRVNRHGQVDVN